MRSILLMAIAAALGACGSDCEEVESAAVAHVLEAIDNPTRCVGDEDCVSVAVSGSCFDACSRAVHRDDALLLDDAIDEAENTICPDYGGCTLIVPPCVPPGLPLCLNEVCNSGAPPG